jgi:anti-sigma factor RsiW
MECPLNSGLSDEFTVGYVARTLDALAITAFDRHIAACPNCAAATAAQQDVWKSLDAWLPAPVSPNFDERLLRRIAIEQRSQSPQVPEWRLIGPIGAIHAAIHE